MELMNEVSTTVWAAENIIVVIGESKMNPITWMLGKLLGCWDASKLSPSLKEKAQDLETWGLAALFLSFSLEIHPALGSIL